MKIFIIIFALIFCQSTFAADYLGVIRQGKPAINETVYLMQGQFARAYDFVSKGASKEDLAKKYCVIKIVDNKVSFRQFEDTLGIASRIFDAILLVDVRYPNKITVSDKSPKAKVETSGNWWRNWSMGKG